MRTAEDIQAFIGYQSWFAREYQVKLGTRYPTMKAALNLYMQRRHTSIVETGCVRLANDFGAGMSTVLFGEVAAKHGGFVETCDISPENMATCRRLTEPYAIHISYHVQDSVAFLEGWNNSPKCHGLLYLDSYDYPLGEMLDAHGGREDVQGAIDKLMAMDEADVLKRHGDLVAGSQEHCLKEIKAAWPAVNDRTIILIDDNNLPGGGKSRLAKIYLAEQGWHCLFDYQQTLWIARP